MLLWTKPARLLPSLICSSLASLFARAEEAMQEGNTLAAKNFCYAAKVEYSKFPSVDAGRLDSVAAMEAKLALMW